jgi:hypothetical protein
VSDDPISRLELVQREIDRVLGVGHATANPHTAGRWSTHHARSRKLAQSTKLG